MKRSTKISVFQNLGGTLLMVGVFAKPLHITSPFDVIPTGIGALLFFLAYRERKKPAEDGEKVQVAKPAEIKRRRLLTIASALVVCALGPIWLPFTGAHGSTGKLIGISAAAFLICFGAAFVGSKLRK